MADSILLSGATGFIAGHTIAALLAAGHHVRGTVRDPAKTGRTAHLRAMPGADARLELVAADLTADDPFSAHADVDVVLHMASPYVLNVTDAQRDLVDPAVQGTLAMLTAAAASKRVRRVVLTSSMAAITDQPDGRILTEADWNQRSSLTRNPYYYSKTMAERAAWDFVKREKPGFDLVVINPFMVIGPAHTDTINTSNRVLADIVNGKYPAIMALEWGFVDVRDVAAAHVAALDAGVPAGRYICASGNMDMTEIVDLMRRQGYGHAKLPKLRLTGAFGTALMRLASRTQPAGIGSYLRTHLGRVPHFDNSKIKREMGLTFRTPEESITDTLADLAARGHIPTPRA